MYAALKSVHLAAVGLSFSLFLLRGLLMLNDADMLRQRWLRILPHCVDTALLAAGVSLAIILHQVPGVSAWLTAKLIALLIYIVLGFLALRPGRPKPLRIAAFAAALAVFMYIVGVAMRKTPWSWLV